jgi:hypothetical protein
MKINKIKFLDENINNNIKDNIRAKELFKRINIEILNISDYPDWSNYNNVSRNIKKYLNELDFYIKRHEIKNI